MGDALGYPGASPFLFRDTGNYFTAVSTAAWAASSASWAVISPVQTFSRTKSSCSFQFGYLGTYTPPVLVFNASSTTAQFGLANNTGSLAAIRLVGCACVSRAQ